MRAVVCTAYGPPEVLQVRDVEKPIPRDDEVLIKIHATTVSSSDCYVRNAVRSAPLTIQVLMRVMVGIARPRRPILGLVLAGEIEAAVTRFRVGDRIYGFTGLYFGAYAEYTCLPESCAIGIAPSNLTYAEAAAIPYGGLLALHFLKKGNLRYAHRVLIYGASGAVGTAAVQLAKQTGAEVTAVCGSTNRELVRSLGADKVIDYTTQDTFEAGERFDLVLDAVGWSKSSPLKVACRKALAEGGTYISVDDGTPRMRASDLAQLTEAVEMGKLKPVIDRCYRLEQLAEAHRYVEQGHKHGNVIVTVTPQAM